jgi:capsular polysaccharide biosynthesis protein
MTQEYENEISLMDLFQMLLCKIYWIIGITMIFLVLGYIYAYVFLEDEYISTASIIVLADNEESTMDQNFTYGQKLVETYNELALSDLVVEQVRTNLNDTISSKELRSSTNVVGVSDTVIIKLSITRQDPVEAQNIANEFIYVMEDTAKNFEGFDNIEILDQANLPISPSGPNRILYLVIAAILGGVISLGMIFCVEILSGTIKSTQDIETKLKQRILGTIPEYDFNQGDK